MSSSLHRSSGGGQPTMIVTAPGSLGDVNPMLAIARELQRGGERVVFLTSERYLPLAQRAGLEVKSLVSEEQFQRMTRHPQIWHPRHGARLLFREAVEHFLEAHYDWLEAECDPGQTVLISHVLDFAGRIYRDRYPQTPFVSVLPAPALLRSQASPPRLSRHVWERSIPRWMIPTLYRLADLWVDRVGAAAINGLRKRSGLPPVSRLLDRWWWSPDLVLGLFPDWYSIASEDRWPELELIGFPLADSADVVAPHIAQQLTDLLGTFRGDKPLVFAPGTAHEQAGKFLEAAAAVCQELNLPGLLLSPNAKQHPTRLPPRVVTAEYLPFSRLLPHAAAIIHHGGVGTTSQALRAGVPQVVVPMAFDQFDNAERVAKLQCGSWLPMTKHSPARLAAHVRNLPRTALDCALVAKRMAEQPPACELAVEKIRQMLAQR
ncbi:MAG: glycosyltransferase [Pirellulaceae bacterium]